MSYQYDQYLAEHKENVKKGFMWFKNNLPQVLDDKYDYDQIHLIHDHSKTKLDEYEAYDAYFYGGNKSYAVVEAFRKAWLLHIHRNPHHWQYWILVNDDPKEGSCVLDMSDNFILEMVCDWWAFSWKSGDLNEIFEWYNIRREHIQLSSNTRAKLESLLYLMETKLEGRII